MYIFGPTIGIITQVVTLLIYGDSYSVLEAVFFTIIFGSGKMFSFSLSLMITASIHVFVVFLWSKQSLSDLYKFTNYFCGLFG